MKLLPCKDCLLIPVCRHKAYVNLMDECVHLRSKIYKKGNNCLKLTIEKRLDPTDRALIKLQVTLNPSAWNLIWDEARGRYRIDHPNFSETVRPIK